MSAVVNASPYLAFLIVEIVVVVDSFWLPEWPKEAWDGSNHSCLHDSSHLAVQDDDDDTMIWRKIPTRLQKRVPRVVTIGWWCVIFAPVQRPCNQSDGARVFFFPARHDCEGANANVKS